MSLDQLSNLPAEIVSRLLEEGGRIAGKAARSALDFSGSRSAIRESIADMILPVSEEHLMTAPVYSVAATDGGMVVDSRSMGDLCTAVGVRVGPEDTPGECDVFIESVARSPKNAPMLGGIMSSMEVMLAAQSEADLVLIDGSMLSTLINVSKSIYTAKSANGPLAERALAIPSDVFRESVLTILSGTKFVAMPKYTTTNEFAPRVPEPFRLQDAKTLATLALDPGEMTGLFTGAVENPKQRIGPALGFGDGDRTVFSDALSGVKSFYYRPHAWTPAYRLDVTAGAHDSGDRFYGTLRAIRDATETPAIKEPFPLYLADLYAKQVSIGSSAVVETGAMNAVDDVEALMMIAMGYRT
jgi:hypothetical protein